MSPEQGSRAVLYLRVSTMKQVEKGHSLDSQRERLMDYAQDNGLNVVEVIVDGGQSGGTLDRPGFQRVLDLAKAGEVDLLVSTKGDRIARSLRHMLNIIARLAEHDVSLALTDEDFDTTTPTGELTLQIRGAVAQYERALIRQRVREGMAAAKAKGSRIGQPPTGYTIEDGKLVPKDPPRNAIAIEALHLHEHGMSLAKIAAKLTADNVPTTTGTGRWYPATVSRFIRGPREAAAQTAPRPALATPRYSP